MQRPSEKFSFQTAFVFMQRLNRFNQPISFDYLIKLGIEISK